MTRPRDLASARRFPHRPQVVTCAAANCTEHHLVDDLERADRMRGRWRCAEHRRPQPPPSADLVDVACSSPGCDQTTTACQPHAAQLDGRWRCRRHYAGTGAPPTVRRPQKGP